MITIKNKIAIAKMHTAGRYLAEIFDQLNAIIKPGVTSNEVDAWIEKALKEKGLISQSKGYRGYKHVSCVSINDEVVHGIPSKDKIIKSGDLVKVDICGAWRGYCADGARCYFVGQVSESVRLFVMVAQSALNKGI